MSDHKEYHGISRPVLFDYAALASGRIFVSKEAAVLHLRGVEGASKRDGGEELSRD